MPIQSLNYTAWLPIVFLSHVEDSEAAARMETLAAATICLVLVVYDLELTGPRLLCLPLRWREEVETLDLRSALLKGP
jgi:hypothetical protein